jgi:protein involved in polysaccharide export with SLBB domain
MRRPRICLTTALAAVTLAGCAATPTPRNLEPIAEGRGYQAQYRQPDPDHDDRRVLRSAILNAESCLPPRGGPRGKTTMPKALLGEHLSRNDLLDVRVGDDETFNGAYVVSRDGTLKLPFIAPVRAQGRSVAAVEGDIAARLIAAEIYAERPRVSVRVADFSSVKVGVTGAVFEPHAVEIGGAGDIIDAARQAALGASTEARDLSAALRAAGGVRPDADLSAVEVHRGDQMHLLDLRGAFEGRDPTDIMLLAGDQIMVHSRNCFQDALMRPGPISPPGVSLFLSNLTQPAASNAVSAIGREVRQAPYGTRYLQAAVNANCAGGARLTNAARAAALVSRNPMTEVSVVIERNIEDLMRRGDRDDYDPYLLPGDALVCYDSSVTEITEIARAFGLVGAVLLLR